MEAQQDWTRGKAVQFTPTTFYTCLMCADQRGNSHLWLSLVRLFMKCACMRAKVCESEDNLEELFSPSTMCVLGVALRSSDLAVSAHLLAEPTHWPAVIFKSPVKETRTFLF